MRFTETREEVTLQMCREDYDTLLLLLGMALSTLSSDRERFYRTVKFINELNAGNRHFTPYTISADLDLRTSENRCR